MVKHKLLFFDPLLDVQQPMIESVVNYSSNKGPNPCSAAVGVEVMKLIDAFAGKK